MIKTLLRNPVDVMWWGSLVLLTAFVGGLWWRAPGETALWLDQGLYNILFLPMLWVAWNARSDALTGEAWRWIARGLGLVFMGNWFWTLEAVGGIGWSSVPLYDLLFLPSYVFFLTGLWSLLRGRPSRRYAALDGVILALGGLAMLVLVVHTQLLPDWVLGFQDLSDLITSLYVVLDLLLVSICLYVLLEQRFLLNWAWWCLLLGFVVQGVADTWYWVLVSRDVYAEGTWLDLGWPLGVFLLVTAARLQLAPIARVPYDSYGSVMSNALAVLCAAMVLDYTQTTDWWWMIRVLCYATLGLAIWRMALGMRDVTRAIEQRRHLLIDDVTGLPNRKGLQELYCQYVERHPNVAGWSVMLVELDGWQEYSRSLGMQSVDRLMGKIGHALRNSIRVPDMIGRVQDSRFAILMPHAEEIIPLIAAERLLQVASGRQQLQAHVVDVTVSVGLSSELQSAPSLDQLMQQADLALADANRQGAAQISAFNGADVELAVARLRLRADLRLELQTGGHHLRLHYQPIVHPEDGRVLAIETLIRWQRTSGLVSPKQFLLEAQRGGLMPDLTAWILNQATRDLMAFASGHSLTVNIPPTLMTPWLVEKVQSALASSGTPPGRLVIEVTEEALVNDEKTANEVIHRLRELGVRVWLDDFGAGWCGLSTVRDLAVDGLKVDRSFVSRIHRDPASQAITAAIVDIGHRLDIQVVCEGVEEPDEVDVLRAMQVQFLQGYLFCKPMLPSDLQTYLQYHSPFLR